ncbi:hypothetical protein V8D89_005029 [Ganoderma adspersum]
MPTLFVLEVLGSFPWGAFSALRAYALSRNLPLSLLIFLLSIVPIVVNFVCFKYGLGGYTVPIVSCVGYNKIPVNLSRIHDHSSTICYPRGPPPADHHVDPPVQAAEARPSRRFKRVHAHGRFTPRRDRILLVRHFPHAREPLSRSESAQDHALPQLPAHRLHSRFGGSTLDTF